MKLNYNIPIKCYTCNKIVSTKQNFDLIELAVKTQDIKEYLTKTDNKYCCNTYFLDIFYKDQYE